MKTGTLNFHIIVYGYDILVINTVMGPIHTGIVVCGNKVAVPGSRVVVGGPVTHTHISDK